MVLNLLVPWSFMNVGNQSEMITGSLRSKEFKGQMTMEVCGKCLRDDSLMDCESGKRVKNWEDLQHFRI